MRALTFDPRNDVFSVKEVPVPQPGADDVLVKVDACGLNPVDAKIRFWKGMVPEMTDSWVPGLDVCGRIQAVGSAVSQWRVGDAVVSHGNMLRPHGGFAEYAVQRASSLLPRGKLDAVTAAAIPCAGWTAWRALVDRLRIGREDSLFVAGGAGGVGNFALQIARHFGVSPVIASCSAPNRDLVLALGATHAADYRDGRVAEQVLEITGGRGVTRGLDAVGRDSDLDVANALAYEGEMVELVDVVRPSSYRDVFSKGLGFHQLSLGSGHRYGVAAERTLVAAGAEVNRLVAEGVMTVKVTATVGLDETGGALTEMLNKRTVGKIVMAL
jgi:NADPH2:quinone reductase